MDQETKWRLSPQIILPRLKQGKRENQRTKRIMQYTQTVCARGTSGGGPDRAIAGALEIDGVRVAETIGGGMTGGTTGATAAIGGTIEGTTGGETTGQDTVATATMGSMIAIGVEVGGEEGFEEGGEASEAEADRQCAEDTDLLGGEAVLQETLPGDALRKEDLEDRHQDRRTGGWEARLQWVDLHQWEDLRHRWGDLQCRTKARRRPFSRRPLQRIRA